MAQNLQYSLHKQKGSMFRIYNQPIEITFNKEVLYEGFSSNRWIKGSPYPQKRRERGVCESRLGQNPKK